MIDNPDPVRRKTLLMCGIQEVTGISVLLNKTLDLQSRIIIAETSPGMKHKEIKSVTEWGWQ